MSTMAEAMLNELKLHLGPIKERWLHPENYSVNIKGKKLYSPSQKRSEGHKPLLPRHRLSVRLELMLALSQCRLELTKEIIADTEAVADAKAHGYGSKATEQIEALKTETGLP